MKKNSGYLNFLDQVSYYIMSEDKLLFCHTKQLLEDYEKRVITPEELTVLIEKKRGSQQSVYSEIFFMPLYAYIDYLFLLVHTAFRFGNKQDIPDKYFSMLHKVQNFFLFLQENSSHTEDNFMREAIFKIMMIFNTWEKVIDKDRKYASSSGVYQSWSRDYFTQFYANVSTKEVPSYETCMYTLYDNCAQTVTQECLRRTFVELRGLYGMKEDNDNSQQFLLKYKSS